MKTLAMLACLGVIPVSASATSTVPVNGGAFWNSATTAGFGGRFGSYDLSSEQPGGSIPIASPVCAPGVACDESLNVEADAVIGDSLVTQNGVTVGVFFGRLDVTTSFQSPSGSLGSSIEVIAPATVSGNVQIDSAPLALGGVPIVSYSFAGTGSLDITGTVQGEGDWFTNGTLTFTGLATVTPEPGTVALLGFGLAALAFGFRFLRQ